MSTEEDIKRGELAQALLNNPLLTEILEGLKDTYIERWLSSNPEDVEGRERLFIAVNVVDDFSRNLRVVVENGKLTKAIFKRKVEKAERAT